GVQRLGPHPGGHGGGHDDEPGGEGREGAEGGQEVEAAAERERGGLGGGGPRQGGDEQRGGRPPGEHTEDGAERADPEQLGGAGAGLPRGRQAEGAQHHDLAAALPSEREDDGGHAGEGEEDGTGGNDPERLADRGCGVAHPLSRDLDLGLPAGQVAGRGGDVGGRGVVGDGDPHLPGQDRVGLAGEHVVAERGEVDEERVLLQSAGDGVGDGDDGEVDTRAREVDGGRVADGEVARRGQGGVDDGGHGGGGGGDEAHSNLPAHQRPE